MNPEASVKNWHVDTGNGVHEADTETLNQWIREGRVLPHHQISRGGMRWLEAGKMPQFAGLFAGQVSTPPNPSAPGYRPGLRTPEFSYQSPVKYDSSPSTGLRLLASTVLMLILAVVCAYAWSYHLAASRDFAALKDEPAAQALQSKFDKEKEMREAFRNAKPAPTPEYKPPPSRSKLGPAKTGDIAERKFGNLTMPQFDDYGPGHAVPPPGIPANFNIPTINVDQEIASLTVKFEAEKKRLVEDVRAEDSKKRFLPAFALLFIGLGGLNVVRIKFLSKKDPV